MKKPVRFHQDLYHEYFFFCPMFTEAEYVEAVRKFNKTYSLNLAGADGCSDITLDGVFVWIRRKDLGALMHECIHAANYCLESKGVKQDTKNDEALTYLAQWLFERCLKHLKVK